MSILTDPRWGEAAAHLPDYLGNHVRVSVTALALGLVVSLPLAIAARNHPLSRGALLGLASIVQTVPGLALLALFYPLLLAQGTPAELAESSEPYVAELLRTPRRQVERLNALLPHDGAA